MEDDEAMLWFARGYVAREREILPRKMGVPKDRYADFIDTLVEPVAASSRQAMMANKRIAKRKRPPLFAEHRAKISAARRRGNRLRKAKK